MAANSVGGRDTDSPFVMDKEGARAALCELIMQRHWRLTEESDQDNVNFVDELYEDAAPLCAVDVRHSHARC